jgi:5-dehydro-2-deoxygluconokinase
MPLRSTNPSHARLNQNLFILPFDHRGSFLEKLLGIHGRNPTPVEHLEVSNYKKLIFESFKIAIRNGLPQDQAGILLDEQFGSEILKHAKRNHFIIMCPVEKSGQNEFEFEYGAAFKEHIEKFSPDFVKALVRYNPEGEKALNLRQAEKLKILSDYCQNGQTQLMLELIIPPQPQQLSSVSGSAERFDSELRPQLMVQAMDQLQRSGVNPAIWKVEGLNTSEASQQIAIQAQSGGRETVRLVILGRGDQLETVLSWLEIAAKNPAFIGFAVGRTLFWEAIKKFKNLECTPVDASQEIANNFLNLCHFWVQNRRLIPSKSESISPSQI